MATTSVSSVSLQRGKRVRNIESKGKALFDNGSREAPRNKREGANNQGAKGSRVPGKRPAVEGKGSGKVKRKWRPNQDQKVFQGSAKEGQGFALWRKRKVQFEYKKLQRKQKKANPKEDLYSNRYPEHLKHLYLAEEEKLKNEEEKLKSQEKQRKPEMEPSETVDEEKEVVPKKKFKKKTSNQKAKEEYERVQRERAKKREEAENNRRKREEAHKLYNQKRIEAYKVLSAKTKKGQPNFNVQMEYLLKKIQSKV